MHTTLNLYASLLSHLDASNPYDVGTDAILFTLIYCGVCLKSKCWDETRSSDMSKPVYVKSIRKLLLWITNQFNTH